MAQLHELSAGELARQLRRGHVTPVEATTHFLERIAAHEELGAFVEVTAERALARARALGRPTNDSPRLWGVPLADKDLVARAGVPTRYGSRAFADDVPTASDPLADALDDLGTISLGKTNTPEFGMTGFTESLVAPPARNPWNPQTGAGGSSGGAAVAVATGMLPFAPGSDGGGSIRIPASTVGIVGLKPSRGRTAMGSGMESPGGLAVTGPLARTVEDAALLLDALVAIRPYRFATKAPGGLPLVEAVRRDPGLLSIGVTTVTPWDDAVDTTLDPAAKAAYDEAVRLLDGAGHAVQDAAWHPTGYPELFRALWRISAAGLPITIEQLEQVEPVTATLIREGRALPAQQVLQTLSAQAAFERTTISAFAPFDVVVTPALAQSPRPIGWYDRDDPELSFAQQCSYAPHTSFVNVCGLPAITVPLLPDGTGRPVSVQLIGRPGDEATILSVAAWFEHERGPLPLPPSV
ncbi:MAG: amidase [Microbacterium sp.]